jgi:adenosylcobinamide-GDP ribazoletransferase
MRAGLLAAPPRLGAPLRSAAAATTFLTRLPLPASWGAPADMVSGAPAFPLVGALLGALVGLAVNLLARVEPTAAAAAIGVALELALTGALHLDGLADSADSLGARGREHALEIMREHTLGTYGVAAIVLDLALKTVALATLVHDPLAVLAAFSVSRAVALPLAVVLPYARDARDARAGTGRLMSERLRWPAALAGMAIGAGIAIGARGIEGAALAGTALLVAAVVGAACRRRLGGVTGDTLGAAVELAGSACLLVAAGWAR